MAWGNNESGQCNVPAELSNVIAIRAANFYSMALKSDGTVICWGKNNFGQSQPPPSLNDAKSIRGMQFHSGSIKDDGSISLWGTNSDGQLDTPDGLTSTNLINSDFTNANLENSNFINADLRNANFSGANLKGANFNGAIIDNAIFTNSIEPNLTGAIFLERSELTISSSIVNSPSNNTEKIRIIFQTNRNKTYRIQRSLNLSEWISIETNILGTGQKLERLFKLENPSGYYRAIQD